MAQKQNCDLLLYELPLQFFQSGLTTLQQWSVFLFLFFLILIRFLYYTRGVAWVSYPESSRLYLFSCLSGVHFADGISFLSNALKSPYYSYYFQLRFASSQKCRSAAIKAEPSLSGVRIVAIWVVTLLR